ncbi:hypothetical protein [Pseudomonas sp. P97.38]|nr:hypothetical protein [Pseudomonas sp. P97.38]
MNRPMPGGASQPLCHRAARSTAPLDVIWQELKQTLEQALAV